MIPVALTTNTPVAQAIVSGYRPLAFGLECTSNSIEGGVKVQAVIVNGINQHALISKGRLIDIASTAVTGRHNLFNGQLVFFGKFMIALVMAGYRHHRARSVVHKHIVANPNWHRLTGQWMYCANARIHTHFFHCRHFGFRYLLRLTLLNKVC